MTTPSASSAIPAPLDFKFIEFNQRRALRGADAAARVEVIDGTETDWLWMSRSDLRKNIKLHGAHPELVKALAAYGA